MKTHSISIMSLGALALACASCSLDGDAGSSSERRMLTGIAPPGTSAIFAYDHAGGAVATPSAEAHFHHQHEEDFLAGAEGCPGNEECPADD